MTSSTFAAVVMTLSGAPRPSQIRWCLLPVFRRSTGDGPVSAPPFSRGCGTHPRRPWTSRAGRPRSAQQAGPGAVGRRRPPAATGRAVASRSARSRIPAPAPGVARRCRCRGRTGCPADTAGPPTAEAPETAPAKPAAAARSMPTSHHPRPTAEYSHPPERPNRHTGHGLPGHLTKILLRVLWIPAPQKRAGRGRGLSGTVLEDPATTQSRPPFDRQTPRSVRQQLLSLVFNLNAADFGVWWGCDCHDDLQGFCGSAGRLRRPGPVGVPGQEARHLALRLADHGPESAGRVDLFLEFTGDRGKVLRGENPCSAR